MKILFLCVANSARSQMAEGLARNLFKRSVDIHSAGSSPTKVNPFAVEAMRQIGIDIEPQFSKSIPDLHGSPFDYVITLCQDEVCPVAPPSSHKLHWPFPDPGGATDELKRESFSFVRDLIREQLLKFGTELGILA